MNRERAKSIHGVGLGLRAPHIETILESKPNVPWFEALSENYLYPTSPLRIKLRQIREHYPICLHGVGMSIGSSDELNWEYLTRLKALIDEIDPVYVSDHLCWISDDQQYLHDLLPLPYTQEAAQHVAARIDKVQEFLGRQILIENVSSYLSYNQSEMTEWEFVNAVASLSDSFILLDVNNIYVSAKNNHFDAVRYLQAIDRARVQQYHLAGYTDCGDYLLDTHNAPVFDSVWKLYEQAVELVGAKPTLIEWDMDIPPFETLQKEAEKAQIILQGVAHVG